MSNETKSLKEVVEDAMRFLKQKGDMPEEARIIDSSVEVKRIGDILHFRAELTHGSPLELSFDLSSTYRSLN